MSRSYVLVLFRLSEEIPSLIEKYSKELKKKEQNYHERDFLYLEIDTIRVFTFLLIYLHCKCAKIYFDQNNFSDN